MEYRKPERKAVKAWRLMRIIILAVSALVFAAVLTATIIEGGTVWIVASAVLGVFTLYRAVGMAIYPLIEYKQWKYLISDEKIEVIHGIFFIKRDIIPVIRIQNITVKQGPIYRKYALHSVEIALASGKFQIVGLSLETAEDIADKVRGKLYDQFGEKREA